MFRQTIFGVAAIAVFMSADWAQAQNLPFFPGFQRSNTGCGCDAGCAAAPCMPATCGCEAPSCCSATPTCGCEATCGCDSSCFGNHMIGARLLGGIDGAITGAFTRMRGLCKSVRLNSVGCCSAPGCSAAPTCGYDAGCGAAPACCSAPFRAAPACAAPACAAPSCAAPSCCAPAPACCSAPTCGSEPACGCDSRPRPIMSRMGLLRDMLFGGSGCCGPSCAAPTSCCATPSCAAPASCNHCSSPSMAPSMYAPPAVKIADPIAPSTKASPEGPPTPPADNPTPADPLKGLEPAVDAADDAPAANAPAVRRPVALPPVRVPDGASKSPRLIRPSSLQQVEPTALRVQTARPASDWKARTR